MRRLIHKARMMFVPRATKHSHLDPADLLKVGTLKYTGFGLLTVFFRLLWGDFVFSLMETIGGTALFRRLFGNHGRTGCPFLPKRVTRF